MLLRLLTLKSLALLLTFCEQRGLVALDLLQLTVLLVDLCLLGLNSLALHTLVGGILACKPQTTIHLREAPRREDEEQTVLEGVLTGDVTHRLYVTRLTLVKLLLKRLELGVEDADVVVDVGDVALYVVNLLLSLPYLGVEHHEVLQTLLHVGLVGAKSLLLLSYFFLHLRALVLQTANGGVGVAGCAFLVLALVLSCLPALGFLRTFSCRVVARRGSGALALCCCRACDRGLLL